MKRQIVCLMLVFTMTMLLTGCGKKAEPAASEMPAEAAAAEEVQEDKEEDIEPVAMANPWEEVSEQGFIEELGVYLGVPENAKDVNYSVLKSEGVGQMVFTIDDIDFCARVKSSAEFEDISGMYYDWTVEDSDSKVNYVDSKCYRYIGDDEWADLCLWYDVVPGYMYSLSATSSTLEGFDIIAIADQIFIPMQGEEEGFIPNDFLQERTQQDLFESYDEVIGLLQSGEGYAYINLQGYDGDLLVITEGTYDNLDGNMASISAYIYGMVDGKVRSMGNAFSGGTAYPVRCEDGVLYAAGNHMYETDFICPETNGLMVKEYISQDYDEEGNASYSGFIREINSFDGPESDVDITSEDEFYKYYEELEKKAIINFTVVE